MESDEPRKCHELGLTTSSDGTLYNADVTPDRQHCS